MAENKTLEISEDIPEQFESDFVDFKEDVNKISRSEERSLSNSNGSISLRDNGQINISSGNYSQIKASPNGTIEDISFQHVSKSNRRKIEVDDLIINNHKLNNKIYEMADFKSVLNTEYDASAAVAGAITMLGTVLVKAWEPNLKRYVLIRRLINMPLFSPSLGNVDVHPGLKITPNASKIKSMQETLNQTGISSLEDYVKESQQLREQRRQERAAAEAEANELEKAKRTLTYTSMNSLTNQNSGGILSNYSPTGLAASSSVSLIIGSALGVDVMEAAARYEGLPYKLPADGINNMDCGLYCKTVLNDCGLAWKERYVPYMIEEAKGYGIWSSGDSSWMPEAGDLIVVSGDDHIIMSDGAGGCWQAGTSRGVYHSSSWRSLFPGGATGYIRTGAILKNNKQKAKNNG